jgi:hypothetical protein
MLRVSSVADSFLRLGCLLRGISQYRCTNAERCRRTFVCFLRPYLRRVLRCRCRDTVRPEPTMLSSSSCSPRRIRSVQGKHDFKRRAAYHESSPPGSSPKQAASPFRLPRLHPGIGSAAPRVGAPEDRIGCEYVRTTGDRRRLGSGRRRQQLFSLSRRTGDRPE